MLPDLPAIIGQWDTFIGLVPADPVNWVQLLPGDSCRWFFSMFAPAASQPLFFPFADPGMTLGYIAPGDRPIEFKYTDYGPIIQQQWLVTGRGSAQPFILASAAIRLRPIRTNEQQRWLKAIGGLSVEMRTFIANAIESINTKTKGDNNVLAGRSDKSAHSECSVPC